MASSPHPEEARRAVSKERADRRERPPMTAPHDDIIAHHDKVLIVDFGSQVTQLIARRVREEGVYSEIVPFSKADEAFSAMKPQAVILSGGPASVHETGAPLAPMSQAV